MLMYDIRSTRSPIALLKETLKRKCSKNTVQDSGKKQQDCRVPKTKFLEKGLHAWKYKNGLDECYILSTKALNLEETFKAISFAELQPSYPLTVNFSHHRSSWISHKSVYFLTDIRYEPFDKTMMRYSSDVLSKKSSKKLDMEDQDLLFAARYINNGMLTLVDSNSSNKLGKRVKYAIKRSLDSEVLEQNRCKLSIMKVPNPKASQMSSKNLESYDFIGFIYDSENGKSIFHKCLSDRIENYSRFKRFRSELKVFYEDPFLKPFEWKKKAY